MPSQSEFERLFLLEFFVDTVYIKNSSVNNGGDDDSSLCISFQFLNYPVMLVCEEDFTPKTKSLSKGTNVVFKSGKSCLFSLRTDQRNSLPPEFDLTIKVIQNMKTSNEINKALVAETVVKLGSSFMNLMKNTGNTTTPTAYIKQDTFPLKDKRGEQVGNLAAFVRLSCFGKLIVTQFQLSGDDNKNYMFKGTDPKKIFPEDDSVVRPLDYLQVEDSEEEEIPRDTPYKDIFAYPEDTDEEEKEEGYEEDEGEEWGAGEGLKKEDEGKPTRELDSKDEQDEKESDTGTKEEDYKEIGAEINGNSITIRVLKKAKRAKKPSLKSIEEVTQPLVQGPIPQRLEAPPAPSCTCQQLLSRCLPCLPGPPASVPAPNSPASAPPPSATGNLQPPYPAFNPPPLPQTPQPQSLNYTQMQGMNMPQCLREDCPLGLYNPISQQIQNPQMDLEPGVVAVKGDQVIFQMANRPLGEPISEKERKLANSIYYKLASGEAGKEVMKNTVQIAPQNAGEPFNTGTFPGGGPVSGLPIDNKQDMFLLKVQQNSDAIDTKSKLEMELRTPKTTEPKPETNSKNTQYIPTDFPAPEKKSIADKGKKKKK